MPYKLGSDGKTILHKKGGKWSVKQVAKSRANAIKAMGLLHGLEHGTIKPSQVGKQVGKGKVYMRGTYHKP